VDTKNHHRRHSELDSIVHIYQHPGNYEVILRVKDASASERTAKLKIQVGNEPPQVFWNFKGRNRSFYQPGEMLSYQLEVSDAEDGSLANGQILPEAVATTMDYLETGFDITSIAQGHQAAKQAAEYARGKLLISRSDCGTCHAEDRQVNGPPYTAIAERYRNNEFAVRSLSKKIIQGGAGNWGQTVMSAHPQVSEEDAGEMVRWILSLGSPDKPLQAFPLAGEYALNPPPPTDKNAKSKQGVFIFKASYRDRGSTNQSPLEGSETIALRPAFQQAEQADSMSKNIRTYRPFNGDTVVLNEIKPNSFFMFKHVDLTGIHSIAAGIGMGDNRYQYGGGRIEARLGSAKGKLLGQVVLPVPEQAPRMKFTEVNIPLEAVTDGAFHDLYFVLKNENTPSKPVIAVDWVRFDRIN
jgi:cytochrome c